MTVLIEKPSFRLREELASLRNQGTYQEQQFYFDGLVTNGTFDTATGWTLSTGWTISGGTLNWLNGYNRTQFFVGDNAFVAGKTYVVVGTVSNYTSGRVNASLFLPGNPNVALAALPNADGNFSITLTPTATVSAFGFTGNDVSGSRSIDNVAIYETDTSSDVIYAMPKGWKPKDVYEDGLLQREGSAHDYEVIYDGFDYVIKPTVAPSATTQTCVIGVKA